jgi:hypothetical protein
MKFHKKRELTKETKEKMSLAKKGKPSWNKGIPMREETKNKLSILNTGKHLSVEARLKVGLAHKGIHRSEETKKKISEAKKGKPSNMLGKHHSEETKRKMSISSKGKNKGKHHSIETRLKMSKLRKGDKCNFWKGGLVSENLKIRASIEYCLWREAVFARDNWTCQKTGVKGGKLRCHHIQNFAQYPELRFAIDNGITLSNESHKEFHRKYGIKNNTKEQLEEFLKICQL